MTDRERATKMVEERLTHGLLPGARFMFEQCLDALKPPEIVRCKECKFYHEDDYNDNGFPICNVSGLDRTEYDFCSYGERKDVAE